MVTDWDNAPSWATSVGVSTKVTTGSFAWLSNEGYCFWGVHDPICHPYNNTYVNTEFFLIEFRPEKPWNGEGLPPVGISCEHAPLDGDDGWQKVEIIAHKNAPTPVAIFWNQKKEHVSYSSPQAFRPMRTAEQIAADQKKQEIQELMVVLGEVPSADYKIIAEAIQKAGYRKQASE